MSEGRKVAAVKVGIGSKYHILKYPGITYCGRKKGVYRKTKDISLKGDSLCINCRVSFYADSYAESRFKRQ